MSAAKPDAAQTLTSMESRPTSPLGTTSKPAVDEIQTIEKSLAARRHRTSFSQLIHPNHTHRKDVTSPTRSPRQHAEPGPADIDTTSDAFEVEEEEGEEEADFSPERLRDFEIRHPDAMPSIHVLKGGEEVNLEEEEDDDGDQEEKHIEGKYVWDGM